MRFLDTIDKALRKFLNGEKIVSVVKTFQYECEAVLSLMGNTWTKWCKSTRVGCTWEKKGVRLAGHQLTSGCHCINAARKRILRVLVVE